jgi:RecA/RadA recombinase
MGKSLNSTISSAIKGTNSLEQFKKGKNLSSGVVFKQPSWIPLSKAFQETLQIPGIPIGHITLLRGHSDTGKTTALLEAAVSAQKMGILPVFIITEMKWDWSHARAMGFQFEEVADPASGEVVDYH